MTGAGLALQRRPDGSLLLTSPRSGRPGVAALGVAVGLALLGAAAAAPGVLAAAVTLPVGLIVLLAGIAAARHRDWMVFDPRAREIAARRGLASIFRPVATLPFDAIEAILVQEGERPGVFAVELSRPDDYAWPVETGTDAAQAARLATALQDVGGWPVRRHARGEAPAGLGPGA